MTNRSLVLGSRASQLAQAQSAIAASWLQENHIQVAENPLLWTTQGDKLTGPLWQHKAGKALFVREIQEALRAGTIDIAVHSLKDVSLETQSDLMVAGLIDRVPASDTIVFKEKITHYTELAPGSRIGTSSLRRSLQLKKLRPDCFFVAIRGNVETRLNKLYSSVDHLDAIVLATAGLSRLHIHPPHQQILSADEMVPAFNQGIIGLECRSRDTSLCSALTQLTPSLLWERYSWERAIANLFKASCQSAVGVHVVCGDHGIKDIYIFAAQSAEHSLFFHEQHTDLQQAISAISTAFSFGSEDWSACNFQFS